MESETPPWPISARNASAYGGGIDEHFIFGRRVALGPIRTGMTSIILSPVHMLPWTGPGSALFSRSRH
jgi:hypothetical protein